MPPKRKNQSGTSVKREKKAKPQTASNTNKMTAYKSNIAGLRAQLALEQEGDTLDQCGYAYVSVGEGSNYATLQSQDPLVSDDTRDGMQPADEEHVEEDDSSSSEGELESGFLSSLALLPKVNTVEVEAEPVPKRENSAFLENLSLQLLEPSFAVPKSKKCEGNQGNRSETQLVAQQLSVAELRDMLQAALEHQEGTSKSALSSANEARASHNVEPSPMLEAASDIDMENVLFEIEGETHVNQKSQNEHFKRSPLAEKNNNTANYANICSIEPDIAPADDGDWKNKYKLLEKQFKELNEKHSKCKQKIAKLEAEKLSADDYSLRIGKELMLLKDKQMIKTAKFTEEEGIPITVAQIEEINGRSNTDSMFVGLLSTFLIGAEKLSKMSVTGQASHRFSKLKNLDGTPKYPPTEGVDPKMIEFICNKVAERVAKSIGPDNVASIRKRSEQAVIKKFIGQKIANLRKAVDVRKARGEILME